MSLEVTFFVCTFHIWRTLNLFKQSFRIFLRAKCHFYASQNASEKRNYINPSSLLVLSLMVLIYYSWAFIYPFMKYLLDIAGLFIFDMLDVNCCVLICK